MPPCTWHEEHLPALAMLHLQINSPFAHKSDSFYFVGDELVMHNKAEYQYVR